jgi:hypothetical protein
MDTQFNKNNSKLRVGLYAFLILCITVWLSIFGGGILKQQAQVYAEGDDNLSGFAWSSNIGWISFNCTNTGTCTTSSYGVNVDDSQKDVGGTGDFLGYAWSSNIGWISFNRSDTGNPPGAPFNSGSGPIAQIDWSTGAMTGWVRALSADGNGWDGWIKLSGTATDGSSYGLSLNGNDFSGYAWGSDVVGWISFNCADAGICSTSNYKVSYNHVNLPPVAPPISINTYRGIQRLFDVVNEGASDPEGEPISIVSLSNPSEGNAVIIGTTGIGYTNTSGTDRQDSFTYTISDGSLTNTGTITVSYGYCGDSVRNGPEDCDGNSSISCSSIGPYTQGTAVCGISCSWDVTSCIATECADSIDNDSDGKVDASDPGCWSNPTDSNTYDPNDSSENNCGSGYCENSTGENRTTCPVDCKARLEEF